MKLPSTHKLHMIKDITACLPVRNISQNQKFCHHTDYNCQKFVTKKEIKHTASTTSSSELVRRSRTASSTADHRHRLPQTWPCISALTWDLATPSSEWSPNRVEQPTEYLRNMGARISKPQRNERRSRERKERESNASTFVDALLGVEKTESLVGTAALDVAAAQFGSIHLRMRSLAAVGGF